MLGGIAIPHDRGLVGHSDADVALHALTDALLGALAEGDIGEHFPPSDPQWQGASSDALPAPSRSSASPRGAAGSPISTWRSSPRRRASRPIARRCARRIAAICGIAIDRVAVKATTNERLGFVGRGEGIAAIATATLRLPAGDPW